MSKETTDIKIEKLGMEAKPYDKVLAKMAELCPAAVQNGKVDFERLKAELADVVDENARETYEFKWVGKNAAMVEANKPIHKTLRPCKEESKNWDATENLYIEGDNLEVLKLLEEGYLGKIKMIYIDPPYNTGNDFVYHDNRVQSEEEMNQGIDLFDEEDNRLLSKSFVRNTESSGRFHSDWCSMMYPRLKLARDLLTDDGVIFISIDDNEVANLKKICDEVFGEDNFVGCIIIKSNPRGSMSTAEIANLHEYTLIYSKQRAMADIKGEELSEQMISEYKYEDSVGKYRLLGLRMRGGFWRRSDRPNLFFPIYVNPNSGEISLESSDRYTEYSLPIQPSSMDDGTWRWSKDKVDLEKKSLIAKKILRNGESVWDIFQKDYLCKNGSKRTKTKSIWDEAELNYQNGTIEIKNLFQKSGIFEYAKPVFLLEKMMNISNDKSNSDIILDFFSGSATTAHAVMQLNAEDGGNRKFIMVQLPEETDEKSEAYKAGYKNICEIGKERIRRAGDKIVQKTGKTDLDIGFRVLKVDDSNMQDVYYKPSELKQSDLLSSVDNIKADRTPLDLLFGVMVEWGVSLSLPLQEIKVSENTIHIVGDNDLVACFDKQVSTGTISKMAELNPTRVVFRDSCFEKDDEKINMFEIFKTICHWDDKQAEDNVRVM